MSDRTPTPPTPPPIREWPREWPTPSHDARLDVIAINILGGALVGALCVAVVIGVLVMAFQAGAYAECRRSWRTVGEWAAVQDECYARFIGDGDKREELRR